MTHSVCRLQKDLDQVLDLLDRHSLFSFTGEERESIRTRVKDLAGKLASIEGGFLTIGLIGGTGVGKSSLMNALAGSNIASTSHRRPHTEQILVYRYAEALPHARGPHGTGDGPDRPPPALPLTDAPLHEITHQSKAIEQILLCDLPDFDSLKGEHRQHVLRFMEHLDLLVWVTSPEKYADLRFYEFLRQAPKAKQNFYFVLNKADLLFRGETMGKGYEQMAIVAGSFQEHVRESQIDDPVMYALSARDAAHSDQPAPWNQFPAFRQQIFQRREMKQITAIKAANLDEEVRQVLSVLEKEVRNLEGFERILDGSEKEMEQHRLKWVEAGQQAIDLWLGKYVRKDILSYRADPDCLVGPGRALAVILLQLEKRITSEEGGPAPLSSPVPSEEIALTFQRHAKWLEDRLNHRILRMNLPSSFRDRLQEITNVKQTSEDLAERFSHVAALRATELPLPSLRGFKVVQVCLYSLLCAFLLLSMGGETEWQAVFSNPGVSTILGVFLSVIHTFFSAKGFAALGSYALINLFFACRFYRRYKKLSRRSAERIIESLKGELLQVWEERIDALFQGLKELRTHIRSRISAHIGTTTQEPMQRPSTK
ncbi:MAG: 50S ribosome-binding GTPase [Desulfobacterales bacterium]|nr:50S ribosome-binding GTPase [Desulfobacterales bacterium]